MSNILILGAGSMGTAFSFPCSDNHHSVTVVGTFLEDDFIDTINSSGTHPYLECKVLKKVKFVKFNEFKNEVKKKVDLIVVAVVSKGIEWIAIELSKNLQEKIPILILTKGLAVRENNYEILAHKMERILKNNGVAEADISAAGGPCLAKGLANRVHTSVVFANKNIEKAEWIANLVRNDYYHIFTSTDVIGVEICAAIKNIFSMIIGASVGLCSSKLDVKNREYNYLNTAASLIQQSINEMIIFTESLNGKKETVLGLAGIGDLYVSADGGRNSKMGYYIGLGLTFEEAKNKKMSNVTIEGAELIMEIGFKVKSDFNVEKLPLMISMINTIVDKLPLSIKWDNFK
jgi:glycerol-3-phosphate dehydrogenase (NAD(P)+)